MKAIVNHFEIPARDPERAARFYREVFGWTIEPVPWEGGAYFKVRGSSQGGGARGESRVGIDGGLMTSDGTVDHPLLVIHVEGEPLEGWLAKIVEAGGEVDLPASRVDEMGFFARFRDPEGNRLGLWQAV